MRFLLNDIELNLTAGLILKQGAKVHIRAKTLSVLNYLISHKNQIVTKQELLSTIWHDVVVQEQVLVQSIKEIRHLLGSEVIKTYPRQGYQWTAELKEINESLNFWQRLQSSQLGFVVAAMLIVLLYLFYSSALVHQEKTSPELFTVAFLPVENDMPDNIHAWVPLEGMDYLSQKLMQNSQLKIIAKEDLLTLLNANEQNNQLTSVTTVSQERISNIQKKLAVDLIVQTRLRGYPQDFQLQYTFYLKHNVERGVEFSNTVEKTLDQLALRITQRYSEDISLTASSSTPFSRDFSNEAFVRGIELYLNRDYEKAIPYFTSSLQDNPELMSARRVLAASYVNSAKVEKGIALMQENIAHAKEKKNQREEIRSNLMLGVLLVNWHFETNKESEHFSNGERYIEHAKKLAIAYQDELFIAYTLEELGKIKRLQQHYEQAKSLQQQALLYHQNFRGDYGQTTALIELARIATAQHSFTQADDYFSQAMNIAKKNGVISNQVAILLAQADIEQLKGLPAKHFAEQAMSLAKKAQSEYLIAQISAWLNDHSHYEIN